MSLSKINLDEIVRFTQRAAGRDKIYRTLQYASRLLAWFYLKKRRVGGSERKIELFQSIESLMSTIRKGRNVFSFVRKISNQFF